MSAGTQIDLPNLGSISISAKVAALTQREVEREIARLNAIRRDEILAFWALCCRHPYEAERSCLGRPPILQDLLLLANNRGNQFSPHDCSSLCALSRTMQDRTSQDWSAVSSYNDLRGEVDIHRIWDNGIPVCARVIDGDLVLLVRFEATDSEEFPLPIGSLNEGDCWFIERHESEDNGGDIIFAYVTIAKKPDGRWVDIVLDAARRRDIESLARDTEDLVLRDAFADGAVFGKRFPGFPSSVDAQLDELTAHLRDLIALAEPTAAERESLVAATTALRSQESELRDQIFSLESRLRSVKAAIADAAASTLEKSLSFYRGDLVRHRVTGEEGVLEIVRYNSSQFQLVGTHVRITGELRRGEWIRVETR